MNLGHEHVDTTVNSYCTLSTHRQGEVMKGIGKEKESTAQDVDAIAEAVVRRMKSNGNR